MKNFMIINLIKIGAEFWSQMTKTDAKRKTGKSE